MADGLEQPPTGSETDSASSPPLENRPDAIPPITPPTGNDAAGRTELPADELRKKRDKIRKWKKRHPGQVHPEEHLLPPVGAGPVKPSRPIVRRDPPPIPSLDASAPGLAGSEGAQTDFPLDDKMAAAEAEPFLDWTPEEVAEISDELILGLDDWDKLDDVKKAKLAKLPEKLVQQIEADAGLPAISKKLLLKFVPKLVARKLNEAKVSPQKSDGALVCVALLMAGADKLMRRQHIAREAKLQGGQTVTDENK